MRDLFFATIADSAFNAGLERERVIDIVKKDNLTIERPRLEIQFLPGKLERTGRKLALERDGTAYARKRELYTVEQDVAANVLVDDEAWLEEFCYGFIAGFPRGVNDARGNWVKITAKKTTFERPRDKRVGDSVIKVFERASELVLITFLWRVTAEEAGELVASHTLDFHYRQEGDGR